MAGKEAAEGAIEFGRTVHVFAPARLHLGFLDLAGNLGRRFGSLGLALEEVGTRLCATGDRALRATGPSAPRALAYAERLLDAWRLPKGLRIEIEQVIPEHVGLGSGTQLGLAVGAGIARLHGLGADAREIAGAIERGARSGIGLGAFEQGGLLVDGGHCPGGGPPPIIARIPFPAAWRVLLVLDQGRRGVHGEAEIRAFRKLPPFPPERAAHLCRLALMVLLPAAVEEDGVSFGRALGEIQRVVGDQFAPAQGGRFASPEIAKVLAWLGAEGLTGVGQSSWGPTGFAVVDDPVEAERLLGAARRRFRTSPDLRFLLCRGRNRGAEIGTAPAREARASA